MAAGKPHGIAPAAPNTIRRIEGGMLSYGSDVTLAENPFEIGFGRLVDLEMDADFMGKAALRKIKAEGVKRRFVGLEIPGDKQAPNQHAWSLRQNGRVVGKLTSMAHSPRLEKNIALGIVETDAAALGTALALDAAWGEATATVVETPFFDPKKAIAAG